MVFSVSAELVPLFGSDFSDSGEVYFKFGGREMYLFSVSSTGCIFMHDRYNKFMAVGAVSSVDSKYVYYKDMFFEEKRFQRSKMSSIKGDRELFNEFFK